MSVSMYWLSERLAGCPDAAGLEYGCVDWFRYGEGLTGPAEGERSVGHRAPRNRIATSLPGRGLSAPLTAFEQPADTQ